MSGHSAATKATHQLSPQGHATRSLNGPRAALDLRLGGNTSDCDSRSLSPSSAVLVEEEPSAAGQWEEGWGSTEGQNRLRRRSACIVSGGKEKELEEMREALKRAKETWVEEATKLKEARKKIQQSYQDSKRLFEAKIEALEKELKAKDTQIESLRTCLNLAREQVRSGGRSIVVMESRSMSLVDKGTQTNDEEDPTVTSGGDTERGAVCSGLSRESCTAILRSVSAERNAQLTAESVAVSELQSTLDSLQQRFKRSKEVVQRISESMYWRSKEELDELVEAQREQVYTEQEMKEKELEKVLKEEQCKKMKEFCCNLESCIRFLEDDSKQKAQQKELERKRTLRRQHTLEMEETVWKTAAMVRQELSKEYWYWGAVGKKVVQKVLAGRKVGSFLVRDSSSNVGTYVLAIKLEDVELIPIKANPRGWCLSDRSLHFASVVDLVRYYTKNSLLEVSLALDIKLCYPVKHTEGDQMAVELSGSESPMVDSHTGKKKEYLFLDLGPVDLRVLATHIPYIAPRWELIGTALGVGRTVLSVRDTEKNADSKCLCVLEAWVEAGKEVSWQKLFQVLQDLELNDTVRKIQQSLQEEGGATS